MMYNARSSHRCIVPKLIQNREYGNNSVHFDNKHNVDSHLLQIAEDHAACGVHTERVCSLPPNVKSTFLMAFSPDKTKVASTHGDHKIYVSDVQTNKCLHTLEGHPRTPWCIAFHPSYSDILASGCLGGEVRIWDLHGGSEVWVSDKNTVIASLAFHPSEKLLVIATFNEVHFWDWSVPTPFAKCKTSTEREKVRFIKFDSMGKYLITGIANRSLPGPQRYVSNLYNNESDEVELRADMLRDVFSGRISARTYFHEFERRYADQLRIGRTERQMSPTESSGLALARQYMQQQSTNHSVSTQNNSREQQQSHVGDDNVSNSHQDRVQEEQRPSSDLVSSSRMNGNRDPQSSSTIPVLSQTLIYSLRRLHAALQLLTDNYMNDAWSLIPNGQARMLRIVRSILNRLDNLIRNSVATYDALTMRNEINQEINLMAEQVLRLPPQYGDDPDASDRLLFSSRSAVELNQRLQDVISNLMHSLERITALEFQYHNLRLMSSAVVSSPMPASSLNWRDERTVTILPNPFSQDGLQASSSNLSVTSRPDRRSNDPSDTLTQPGHNTSAEPSFLYTGSNSASVSRSSSFGNDSDIPLDLRRPNVNLDDVTPSLSSLETILNDVANRIPVTNSSSNSGVLNSGTSANPTVQNPVSRHSRNLRSSSVPPGESGVLMNNVVSRLLSIRRLRSRNSGIGSAFTVLRRRDDDNNRNGLSHTSASRSSIGNNLDQGRFRARLRGDLTYILRSLRASSLPFTPTANSMSQASNHTASSTQTVTNASSVVSNSCESQNVGASSRTASTSSVSSNGSTRRESNASTANCDYNGLLANIEHRLGHFNGDSYFNSSESNDNSTADHDEDISSNDNDEEGSSIPSTTAGSDDLMDDALTIQSSFPFSLMQNDDTSSNENRSQIENAPSARPERFRLNVDYSSSNIFRVPRVHIDTVDTDESNEATPVTRPRSPPLGHVIAGNINRLPLHIDNNLSGNFSVNAEQRFTSNNSDGNQSSNLSRSYGLETNNNVDIEGGNDVRSVGSVSIGPSHLHANYTRGLSGRIWEDESSYSRHVNSVLRRAIDRVISGVGSSMAEPTLAGEILTHRIQCWSFSYPSFTDISSATKCVVVRECKIHNDASVDISSDGMLLAALVPVHRRNIQACDGTMLGLYSLEQSTLGQCLYTWTFGLEAITVSLSPLSRYIMVGLASCRVTLNPLDRHQKMAKILKIEQDGDKRDLVFIRNLEHTHNSRRQYVSLNAACWLPLPGSGVIYGTNRGDLRIRYPKQGGIVYEEIRCIKGVATANANQRGHYRMTSNSAGTQTVQPHTNTIATQTNNHDYSNLHS